MRIPNIVPPTKENSSAASSPKSSVIAHRGIVSVTWAMPQENIAMAPEVTKRTASACTVSAPRTARAPSRSATLFVGDLHPQVTENNLDEIVQPVARMRSIRVQCDRETRRNLEYAHAHYYIAGEAKRELGTKSYFSSPLTKNIPPRIIGKTQDQSVPKSRTGNTFVKNLSRSMDSRSLYEKFRKFGPIINCKVVAGGKDRQLRYGIVQFERSEQVAEAEKKLNGMHIDGRKVFVGKLLTKKERVAAGLKANRFTKVYVKNLDESLCNEEKLKNLFSKYGDITSIDVAAHSDGTPNGFAFLTFADPSITHHCTLEMNGKVYEGKKIFVGRAHKRSELEIELSQKYEQKRLGLNQNDKGIKLYVNYLSNEVNATHLRHAFSLYGTITSCKIMRDERNRSRGFGFLCFTKPKEATKAVTELNGCFLGRKRIYVALAKNKDARCEQRETQIGSNRSLRANTFRLRPL